MRKLFNILALLLVIPIMNGFYSCKNGDDDDDDDNNNLPEEPTLTFVSPTGNDAFDIQREQSIPFNFTAKSNPSTKADLAKATIKFSYTTVGRADSFFLDTLIQTTEAQEFTFQSSYAISKFADPDLVITAVVYVEDVKGKSASKTFTMTMVDLTNMYIWERTLSSWQIDTGSFFSASTGQVYKIYQGKNNGGWIDFVYYYSTNDAGTFASPDNDVFGLSGDVGSLLIHKWNYRKVTKFKRMAWGDNTTSDAIWENEVINFSKLKAKFETADTTAGQSKIIAISDGEGGQLRSYIGFKTEDTDPIYGIIKVVDQKGFEPGRTIIDIIIKVQRKQ